MQPTWKGFIHTTRDGLVLLEACLQGRLNHIPRRPHDRERQSIISSGNIFVYEENASGIRRWTDGISWSPSRIMGNFLVYRELRDGQPTGEKKRAAKKRKRASEEPPARDVWAKSEEDRQLIGSLSLDAYNFKEGGLAKKTLSVELRGIRHHIISYYRIEDVKSGLYGRPLDDEILASLEPRRELVENSLFKFPVEDREDKINVMVSPQTPSRASHLQMVNAGLPVMMNVPQTNGQVHHSIRPARSTPPLTYQPRPTSNSYHLPVGPLDSMELDLKPLQHEHLHPSAHHQAHHHGHLQLPSVTQKPINHSMRTMAHQESEHEGKRQRREGVSEGDAHNMYWGSTQVTSSEWSFPSLTAFHPNKYVEDMQYQSGFLPHEYSHTPTSMYMVPQSQAYSG
jgi:Gti1/Pac2 family transcription factor